MEDGRKKGFTLIELMIALVIIAILAAIAIPQYNKYLARTQVAEAFVLLGSVKQALTLYYQENGVFPTQPQHWARHDALGIPRRGQYRNSADYVREIRVMGAGSPGGIQVRFDTVGFGVNAEIAGKRFNMIPSVGSGVITGWTCAPIGGSAAIDEQYIKSCM